eukprot:5275323-Amphidinium_carterae.1
MFAQAASLDGKLSCHNPVMRTHNVQHSTVQRLPAGLFARLNVGDQILQKWGGLDTKASCGSCAVEAGVSLLRGARGVLTMLAP